MKEQENIQTVQQAYDAFLRADVPAILELMTEECDWYVPGVSDIPYAGRRQGRAAVSQFFRLLAESEDTELFNAQKYFASENTVVVLGHYRGKVKRTSQIVDADWVQVFTCKDGRIAKFEQFHDTAKIAEAYGDVLVHD